MQRLSRNRWMLTPLFAVMLAGELLVARAQTDGQSPTTPAAPTLAPSTLATESASNKPTAEDIGDSLAARQRYQAAIGIYDKIQQKTATTWNKMGIAYQMMFNNKDAERCYKESLRLKSAQRPGVE